MYLQVEKRDKKSLMYIFSIVHLLALNLTFKTFLLREQKKHYVIYKKNYIINKKQPIFD